MSTRLATIRDLLVELRTDALALEAENPTAARVREKVEQLTNAIQEREIEAWTLRKAGAVAAVDWLPTS